MKEHLFLFLSEMATQETGYCEGDCSDNVKKEFRGDTMKKTCQ